MKIERERKGFYRALGKKKNLRIVRRENGWYVEQYPVHGTGVIGPVKTLKEAKAIAELEGDE